MPIDFRTIDKSARPLYRGLADELARQIRNGELQPGERLLTQDKLSKLLGIARNTVCRAYQVLDEKRLVSTEVGRGTFVRSSSRGGIDDIGFDSENKAVINFAFDSGRLRGWRPRDRAFRSLLSSIDASKPAGERWDPFGSNLNSTGSGWLQRHGVDCRPERVVACWGHHHALLLSILATTEVGDRIAVDRLTYPGILEIAGFLGRQVVPLSMDRYGTDPASLDEICTTLRPQLVYLIPSLHHPMSITIPSHRREELGRILHRHRIPFVEDDSLRLLSDQTLDPLASRYPDLGVYIASFSKVVCREPQLEFLAIPETLQCRFRKAIWATLPPIAGTAARVGQALIDSGMADDAIVRMRSLVRNRVEVASDRLGLGPRLDTSFPYLWLESNREPSSDTIAERALTEGVRILSAASFLAAPATALDEDGNQICLIGPESLSDFEAGLRRLATVLAPEPRPALAPAMCRTTALE